LLKLIFTIAKIQNIWEYIAIFVKECITFALLLKVYKELYLFNANVMLTEHCRIVIARAKPEANQYWQRWFASLRSQ
jgi:hypothetical protein